MSSISHPIATDKMSGQLVPEKDRLGLVMPKRIDPEFSPYITGIIASILHKDRAGYNRRHKKWLTNWLFYDGRQYGFWDEESGAWEDAAPSRSNQFYINNNLSWFVDATQKEWARARTELLVRPTDDRPESADAARMASEILGHYQRQLRGPIEHQGEGLTAAMCSVYFRYTYYSLQAGRQTAPTPQYASDATETQLGPSLFSCGSCGGMGGMDELIPPIIVEGDPVHEAAETPQEEQVEQQLGGGPNMHAQRCPYCNQMGQMSVVPGGSVSTQKINGYEDEPIGDIVSENVDPFEIRVHPKARGGQVHTSPYIYRRRTILKSVLQQAFNLQDLPTNTEPADEAGLRYQKNLERSSGSVSDRAHWGEDVHRTKENDEEDMVLFTQLWLDFPMYASYVFPREEKLANGTTAAAGTKLADLYPDGLYVALIGDKVVDCRNENKNKHWVGGVYRLMPTSFWGRGIEDAVWQQRLLNDTYNLLIAYLKHCSSPTVLYNPHFIDGEDISGQPGEIIPVESAGSDAQLSAYYSQIQPPSIPSQVPAFIEQCKKDMQSQIGAFSPIAGDPSIDTGTATGIKLLRESSVALIAMALTIKAKVDEVWGQQILQLCQDNFIEPHTIHVEGLYGKVEIKAFSNIDIKGKLQVTYAEHSVTPRSEIELRNDILEAMAAGGVPLGIWNPSLPHELRCLLAERFNIPYNADLYSQSERLAKIRLHDILDLMSVGMQAMSQQGVSPEMPPGMGQPEMAQPGAGAMAAQVMQGMQQPPVDPMAQGDGGSAKMGATSQGIPGGEQPEPPPPTDLSGQADGSMVSAPGPSMQGPAPVDPMQQWQQMQPVNPMQQMMMAQQQAQMMQQQMQMMLVQQVLQEVPIDPLMDDHNIHMEFLKDWMHTDDGIYAPEIVKLAVRQRYQEHFQANIQMAQMQMMGQMMSQGPQAPQGGGPPPATKAPKKDKNVAPSANKYMGN